MGLRFDEAKATQAAGLILTLRGGKIHYLKLIKRLYLVDREALLRWGAPVTTDRYVSMDDGPVVSNIYSLITEDKQKPIWAKYISPPVGDYEVKLQTDNTPTDRLSRAEENLIREIYAQHGYKNRWDIVDYCHKLPEWQDPHGTSIPIHIRMILRAAGQDEDHINAVLRELRAMANADETLSGAF